MFSKVKANITLLACILSLSLILAACGANTKDAVSSDTHNAASSVSADNSTVADKDPLGKYDPGIELHSVSYTGGTTKFPAGDNINNNVWTRELKDSLGIDWKWDWLADSSQWETKLNVTIASGSLPDVFMCTPQQLKTLASADQLADMTTPYQEYASPLLQKAMNDFPEGFESGKFDGKLYGLSQQGGAVDTVSVIWIRDDWMKKLGLQKPNTLQDLLKIADAFTNQDPDGNKKKDTYGIAVMKDLYGDGGFADLKGFFNAYHAYPQNWIKDSQGNIVYGSIQPEMKNALRELQNMYKSGILDKEYGVKDDSKVAEDIGQNKVGIEYGANWNGYWPLNSTVDNDKNAIWKPYAIVSADDKPAIAQESWPVSQYIVVNKNCKNPEAAIKIVNLKCEKFWGKTGDYVKYFSDGQGMEPMQYIQMNVMLPNKNIENAVAIADALKTGETSKMNSEALGVYKQVTDYVKNGKTSTWGAYAQEGPEGAFFVIKDLLDNKRLMLTASQGITTDTMVEKKAALDKIEKETITKIIMGGSVDELFDKFVSDYKKLGGDKITQELNSELKNK